MRLALLYQFTRQDLVDRYAGSVLGGLWTFVQPLMTMLVFILVFSQIMAARLPGVGGAHSYSIYLVSGLLCWIAFSSTLMRTTTVLLDRAHLIQKIGLSLWSFPLSVVLGETIVFVVSFAFFVVYLVLVDVTPSAHFAWIPLVLALQQAFAYALGLILAPLAVFYRDIKESVTVLIQLWFWLTPIVYVETILPEGMRDLLQLNPMYGVLDAYHAIILYARAPDWGPLARLALAVLVLLLIGRWLMRRLESDIRDLI